MMLKVLLKRLSAGEALVVCLVIIATLARFLWLDKFPSMSHDEVEQAVSALGYSRVGVDSSGYGFPLSLFRTETEGRISAVPPVLLSLYLRFAPYTQFSIRLLYALVFLASALLVYKIATLFTEKRLASLASVMVFLVSPWGMMLSRWAADVPFAMLFTLAGVYFAFGERRRVWLSLASITLAFYSYHGVKPLFPFLVLIFTLFSRGRKAKVVYGIGGAFVVAIYIFLEVALPGKASSGRLGDTVVFQGSTYAEEVDARRKTTIDSPFTTIFVNKYVLMAQDMASHYFSAFSPDVLLMSGDPRATYRLGEFGLLHVQDVVFAIIGGFAFLVLKKRNGLILLLLGLVSPVATAVSNVEISVVNRSFLLLPVVSILAGMGISYSLSKIQKRARLAGIGAITFFYVLTFVGFIHYYFFEYSVAQQENSFLSERVLASYVDRAEAEVYIVTNMPRSTYMSLLFYSERGDAYQYLPVRVGEQMKVGKTIVIDNCPEQKEGGTYIVASHTDCEMGSPDAIIVNQKDAGKIFSIYKDTLCERYELAAYRRFHFIDDYEIERMDTKNFCERWINKI